MYKQICKYANPICLTTVINKPQKKISSEMKLKVSDHWWARRLGGIAVNSAWEKNGKIWRRTQQITWHSSRDEAKFGNWTPPRCRVTKPITRFGSPANTLWPWVWRRRRYQLHRLTHFTLTRGKEDIFTARGISCTERAICMGEGYANVCWT